MFKDVSVSLLLVPMEINQHWIQTAALKLCFGDLQSMKLHKSLNYACLIQNVSLFF